jgi:hypothetical protein
MFLYQEHLQGGILVIQLDLGEYQMTYHQMNQGNYQMVAFSQNRRPNNEELNYIYTWVQPLYEEQRVINMFRDSFRNCLEQDELSVVTN